MANKFTHFLKSVVVRVYALGVLLAVLWCGYAAVTYLYTAVFHAARVPQQYKGWQADVTMDTLTGEESPSESFPGRAPMRHYHGVVEAFHPDPNNGCAISGCHNALPHERNKALRAFANMHATFMTCGTCHARVKDTLEATWLDLATGKTREEPALFKLIDVLSNRDKEETADPRALHAKVVPLLNDVRNVAGPDPVLDHLAVAMDTSEPGSPVWRHTLDRLAEEMPRHAWGRYGAKIIPRNSDLRVSRRDKELDRLAKQYREAPDGSQDRQKAWQSIHEQVVFQPSGCLACHNQDQPRVDFEGLGYSTERARELRNVANANLMQRLQKGETFHLPGVGGGSDGG